MQGRIFTIIAGTALVLLATFGIFMSHGNTYMSFDLHKLSSFGGGKAITHLVLLDFKSSVQSGEIQKVLDEMTAMKDQCIHPISQGPYIRGIRGGKNISPTSQDSGVSHAFVVEFESVEHRDYYLDFDPAHKAFREIVAPLLERPILSVDFSDGKYYR